MKIYPSLMPDLIPEELRPSDEVERFVETYESLHDGSLEMIGLQPKPDARGIWTEGFGHAMRGFNGKFLTTSQFPTLEDILPYSSIKTEAQAARLLQMDISDFAAGVRKRLTRKVKQCEFDALVSHSYNCGFSETIYRMVNGQDPALKSWWISHYITAGGTPLKGLRLRRWDEWEIYIGRDYERDYNRSV